MQRMGSSYEDIVIRILFFLLLGNNCLIHPLYQSYQELPGEGTEIEFKFNGEHRLFALLGVALPAAIYPSSDCAPDNASVACHQFGDFATYKVTNIDEMCTQIEWTSTYARRLEDCFLIRDDQHFYGGAESLRQYWPVNPDPKHEAAYVTSDSKTEFSDFGNALENYWLFSQGASIHVEENTPLFLSWNTTRPGQLCFISADQYPYDAKAFITLNYTVCVGPDVKSVHVTNFPKWYQKPAGMLDQGMLLRPIWSTTETANQSDVVSLARQIVQHGFEGSSHIEIQDGWETCHGETDFDPDKFPDPKEMVDEILSLGFKITLWTHPFINLECPSFIDALQNHRLVVDQKRNVAFGDWRRGELIGLVDVTIPESATWWKEKLAYLQTRYGITSFTFDGGEVQYLPHSSNFPTEFKPNIYTTKFVDMAASFGGMVKTRVARMTQEYPIFTRISDRTTHWGNDGGLKSVIPTVLLLGIVGYPFTTPGMVAGQGPVLPGKELYIRWVQVNTFMPAMQFSLPPWATNFDAETIEIVKDCLLLRDKYSGDMLSAAFQARTEGRPIIRPLWWLDSTDAITFTEDQAFLLGDRLLVAPVVENGATSRDIYLPIGTWLDERTNTTFSGPTLLPSYPAALHVLPYFVKMDL